MSRPLHGVRVIDLTRLLPGAYATQLLVDLGADVIKIEDPRGGDGMRRFGTPFDLVNRGKKSITLDLRSPDARPVLESLLTSADVAVHSFRPSTSRRLGVDVEALHAKYPRLICASITGFGYSGPRVETAAHDINYRALAGQLARGSTGSPRAPGPLIADIGAAMQAAIGILAALVERQRSGAGAVVDAPIVEAARVWTNFPDTDDLESACYTLYETADGQWLALGALETKFWRGFCERIGRPDFVPRQRERDIPELRAILRSKRRDEWLRIFEGADVCLTPVLGVGQIPPGDEEPQPGPTLGADTDAVLAGIGVNAPWRDRLRSAGVI